jgi:hypothetical protein
LVMGPNGTWKQACLCWRRPAAVFPTFLKNALCAVELILYSFILCLTDSEREFITFPQ